MSAKSGKSDRTAKWPEGWGAEADRLAIRYQRTVDGIDEYEQNVRDWKAAAEEFKELMALAHKTACGFRSLQSREDADQLVRAFHARELRTELVTEPRGELDKLLVYRAELELAATHSAEIAADFELAAELLQSRCQSDKGNQSTLALRFTIAAAASAYTKLFGKRPGRSRSDYGRFGRFVLEIIKRVPSATRPAPPSPSAIDDAVDRWERRKPVAR